MTNDKYFKLMIQRKRKFEPFQFYRKGERYDNRLLKSGFYENQTWGALHKCWLGFVIAKDRWEFDKLEMYAKRIKKLERELEILVTDFSDWGIK